MHVKELWRYPVKSMLGEPIDSVRYGPPGIAGDRAYAVLDSETGLSLSAKRYAVLLSLSARTVGEDVVVDFPDGTSHPADSPVTARLLSDILDRPVVVGRAEDLTRVRHEFAGDSATGLGGSKIVETRLASFCDGSPVHLITTATLGEFTRRSPGSRFERARFRPNLLVDSEEAGFVEHGWVGSVLQIGGGRFDVIDHKIRCVVTTRPQQDLPEDRAVLRTIARSNENRAGISLRPLANGTLRVGDRAIPD